MTSKAEPPDAEAGRREVFEDREGRQFVLSDADERAYGRWLPPADEPSIV
jgi:hypothetical protein